MSDHYVTSVSLDEETHRIVHENELNLSKEVRRMLREEYRDGERLDERIRRIEEERDEALEKKQEWESRARELEREADQLREERAKREARDRAVSAIKNQGHWEFVQRRIRILKKDRDGAESLEAHVEDIMKQVDDAPREGVKKLLRSRT